MPLNLFQGLIKVVLRKSQQLMGAHKSLFDDALGRVLIFT